MVRSGEGKPRQAFPLHFARGLHRTQDLGTWSRVSTSPLRQACPSLTRIMYSIEIV
uniref:Uncharacterized protein n=1 Tax=Arundo donax TaxID=35708 RepID=A0A0A9G8U6_ARUDO